MSQKTSSSSARMRGLILVSALATAFGGFFAAAWAKEVPTGFPPDSPFGRPTGPFPPARLSPDLPWCRYPYRTQAPSQLKTEAQKEVVVDLQEIEPNATASEAQVVPVSSSIGSEVDATIKGSIEQGDDVDFYRIFVNRGDVVGLAVTTNRDPYDFRPDLGLDSVVAVCDLTEEVLVENDDDGGSTSIYPPASPLPRIETPYYWFYRWDAALAWIAPETGDYLVRVTSSESSRRGDYELKIVLRRPAHEHQAVGATQILFLDFDGVEDFNAVEVFGYGWYLTTLSPMRDFLTGWGLTRADEAAVVDAVVANFQERLDNIRRADLNGDRDIDLIDGHMDFEVRNSRDHVDPWGQPNVSRIIIGGSMYELGIPTLGIAQSIDPGNFAPEETAVVLLDYLSWPEPVDPDDPFDPFFWDSVNGIPRSPNLSIIDAVGRVVGNIAAHEAVHTLGLWHTDNSNDVACLIDTGGNGVADEGGVGSDGVMGTGDDEFLELVPDAYDPYEGVGTAGLELTDVRVAFALSTGKSLDIEPPPPVTDVAKVSISVMPKIGVAPLLVGFAGGGVDPSGGQFVLFNWNFGDQTTGNGAYVTHTYDEPGTYVVTLSGVTDNAETAQAVAEVIVLSEPNQLPTARIIATPTKGDAPLMVLFQADAEDPDGEIITYGWDFGDGQGGSGQAIDHVYLAKGVYVATLSVTDNLGATQRVTKTITVTGPSPSASANDPIGGDSPLPLPLVGTCGAGTASALVATLAGLMGMAPMRRRH